MNNLDPQILAALLQQWQSGNPTQSVTNGQYGIQPVYGWEGGDGGGQTITPNVFANAPDSADGKRQLDQWDQLGNYIGRGTDTNSWTKNDWLLAIAALGGGALAGGALGGGAAAGGAGGAATAEQLGMMGLGTQGMGGAAAAAGGGGALGLESAFGGATGAGAGLDGAATLGGAAGGGAGAGGGLFSTLGSGSTLANIAGAVLGAAGAKDQQQSSNQSRDPWAPAQPLLKDLINQGQTLNNQYQQNPFSGAQKTAYNNIGGLLNTINGNVGGLLSGFGANASGANNYDRANPRKQLTGSSFNLSGFAPGLLNFFPKG